MAAVARRAMTTALRSVAKDLCWSSLLRGEFEVADVFGGGIGIGSEDEVIAADGGVARCVDDDAVTLIASHQVVEDGLASDIGFTVGVDVGGVLVFECYLDGDARLED